MIRSKIGLEAEFLLRNKKGELVLPADFGFSTDDFMILGEFRADAGWTVKEVVGNFFGEIAHVMKRAKEEKLTVDFSGMAEVSPEKKAQILRAAGMKAIPPCDNVYGRDLLEFSDDVVKKGKIVSSRISAGLHVHFSRRVYHNFVKGKEIVSQDTNILTKSQMMGIVRNMDKNILPKYQLKTPLKYRQPGFYEIKAWGFEYRSLPMIPTFTNLEEVVSLVTYAFSLLEKLGH